MGAICWAILKFNLKMGSVVKLGALIFIYWYPEN